MYVSAIDPTHLDKFVPPFNGFTPFVIDDVTVEVVPNVQIG